MSPEMEAAAWEGLATNHAAQTHAEGHDTVARWLTELDQVTISRERLTELERLPRLVDDLRRMLDLQTRRAERAESMLATLHTKGGTA